LIGYPNTSNFVKIPPLRDVFSTLFSVFGYHDETLSLVFARRHDLAFISHLIFSDITMIVETSSVPLAGTDANIKIKIFGTKGNVPEKQISGSFEYGR